MARPPVVALPRVAARLARLAARSVREVSAVHVDQFVFGPDDAARDAHVRRWAHGMLRALAVEVVPTPAVSLPWTAAYLRRAMDGTTGRMVVSNHRSMLDILVLLAAFGGHLLSRDDLARWPVIGRLAPYAGTLYVDRSSTASGSAAMLAMISRLREGRSLTVFPEGTTYPDDTVRDFHAGAFAAALRTGAPIVPVGLAYAGDHATFFREPFTAHATRLLQAPRTRVALAVGDAMPSSGASLRALSRDAHTRVQSLVHEARAALGG
jgi:1-acyl-sn-glycerol-3-phosphate acyltransferase